MALERLHTLQTYNRLFSDFVRSPEARLFFHLMTDRQPIAPESLLDTFPDYGSFSRTESPLVYLKGSLPQRASKVAVALMGLSAVGKDAVLRVACDNISDGIARIVTVTDRPRDSWVRQEALTGEYSFCTTQQIKDMISSGQLIESVFQGGHIYGTPASSVETALQEQSPFVVWRGDITGSIAMRKWFAEHHQEIPFISMFILPNMLPRHYFKRLVNKRGWEDSIRWRLKRAIQDLQRAPKVADVILLNPPEPDGVPTQAAAAMCGFLETLRA